VLIADLYDTSRLRKKQRALVAGFYRGDGAEEGESRFLRFAAEMERQMQNGKGKIVF
jgi:hypothetical protein